ncbi:hypothetical protein [Gracilibacillus kekensis]|uniref:Chain length determinant protein n=1 Tax=Gracilibacillus kekensis TaxID=1027249 RepID=A0A1M7PWZ3_9BACI|nr:hypothetical protein [Gracilibacillus kekensis]SHN22213.1 Chain length determinant protein [Gracilibacillus kekensis]
MKKDVNHPFVFINKKRIFILFSVVMMSATGYLLYGQSDKALFQTSTQLMVETDSETMTAIVAMIKDDIIIEELIKELQLPYSKKSLTKNFNVQRVDDSQVIRISVVDTEPDRAVLIANTTARIIRNELEIYNISQLIEAKSHIKYR